MLNIFYNPIYIKQKKVLLTRSFKHSILYNALINYNYLLNIPMNEKFITSGPQKRMNNLIKTFKPIVVPIVIDGFRRSFDKKGIRIKKKDILQSMEIKKPLDIDYDKYSVEEIIEKIEYAIEQHSSFLKVIPKDELLAYEETNKKRKF